MRKKREDKSCEQTMCKCNVLNGGAYVCVLCSVSVQELCNI